MLGNVLRACTALAAPRVMAARLLHGAPKVTLLQFQRDHLVLGVQPGTTPTGLKRAFREAAW